LIGIVRPREETQIVEDVGEEGVRVDGVGVAHADESADCLLGGGAGAFEDILPSGEDGVGEGIGHDVLLVGAGGLVNGKADVVGNEASSSADSVEDNSAVPTAGAVGGEDSASGSEGRADVDKTEHVINYDCRRGPYSGFSSTGVDASGCSGLFGQQDVARDEPAGSALHADDGLGGGVVEAVADTIGNGNEAAVEGQLVGVDADGFGLNGIVAVHVVIAGAAA